MRALLDTNVLVAALTTRGECRDLFEMVVETHHLVVSEKILDELERVLATKFGYTAAEAYRSRMFVTGLAEKATSPPLPHGVCRDPHDDHVLSSLGQKGCGCLVTGDKDLLTLKRYKGKPILSPGEFWKYEWKAGAD